jgi:hypothetical protein
MNRIACALVLVLVPLAGCSYQLVSPPARMVSLESAKTATPGETVVGVHGAGYASVFDPGVGVGSAGVRRGVAEQVEVDADASWGHLSYDGYPDIDRNIFAGRIGAKASNRRGWAAIVGGVGGGYAPAAGGFTAADVGGVVSLPNCAVVPFASAMGFASLPVGAKEVDFRNADGTLSASDKATPTLGFGLGAGVEIPLDHGRCQRGLTPPRIQLGLSGYSLYPSEGPITTTTTVADGGTSTSTRGGRYGAFGAAIGFEWPF